MVLSLKNFIQDEHKNNKNFSEFQHKISEFDTFRKSFRRKGLFINKSTNLNKTFYEASNFLDKFIATIINFKESLSGNKDLDFQFRKDFDNFTRVFGLIHGVK